jgi:hypothetical protein
VICAPKPLGGVLFTPALDQDVQHEPVLVDRVPKPVLHPSDLHRDLVQVPFIAGPGQPAADLVGEPLAELQAPLPYGFMADRNAAGGEDLINVAQAERKAEIEPDGEADDLGWEAVTGAVGRSRRCHQARLRDLARLDKQLQLS